MFGQDSSNAVPLAQALWNYIGTNGSSNRIPYSMGQPAGSPLTSGMPTGGAMAGPASVAGGMNSAGQAPPAPPPPPINIATGAPGVGLGSGPMDNGVAGTPIATGVGTMDSAATPPVAVATDPVAPAIAKSKPPAPIQAGTPFGFGMTQNSAGVYS